MKSKAMAEGPTISEKIYRRDLRASFCSFLFEHETPKEVIVRNEPLGYVRLVLHTFTISFVVLYQLWYARGYQEFTEVESCLTMKIKGFSM